MKRVTGLGGVFFKTADKAKTLQWYRDHLGIESGDHGFPFLWREHEAQQETGYTVWSPFDETSEYFAPSSSPYMINYRVHDLEGLVAALREEGVTIVGGIDEEANGKFAWILDPDGRKIELWEPVPSAKDPYLAES